jgi:hypothetical protein
MSRLINTQSPGRLRHRARRTAAEILRHLMCKHALDDESKDMAATLVFCLREINDTVQTTVDAWENRNYYVKADRFRAEWEWVLPAAKRLKTLILEDQWENLPLELGKLVPHFGDIRIVKMTRPDSTWKSGYQRLVQEQSQS